MKVAHQIKIDRLLIKPLNIALNLLVRMVGKLLRINHSLNHDFTRIAICKYKGMGSILQATPLIQSLKDKFPAAQITLITSIQNQEFASKISIIDKVIVIDDRTIGALILNYPKFILQLISQRFEVFLDLEIYSNFSSLNTTLSMSKNRVGFYLRSSNYRMGIYTHMMYYNTNSPILQTYLQLGRLLNCETLTDKLYPFNNIQSRHATNDSSYIVINPNASDLRIERRWEKSKVVALIDKIQQQHINTPIYLIGSKSEYEYVQSIFDYLPNNNLVYNMAGNTSIDELINLLRNAKCLISNDTGPMHLAMALNTPTVALFGPCSPSQYGSYPLCIPLYHKIYCSPCVHEFDQPPCNGNNICMQLIQVNEVASCVDEILHGNLPKPLSNEPRDIIYTYTENQKTSILGFVRRNEPFNNTH